MILGSTSERRDSSAAPVREPIELTARAVAQGSRDWTPKAGTGAGGPVTINHQCATPAPARLRQSCLAANGLPRRFENPTVSPREPRLEKTTEKSLCCNRVSTRSGHPRFVSPSEEDPCIKMVGRGVVSWGTRCMGLLRWAVSEACSESNLHTLRRVAYPGSGRKQRGDCRSGMFRPIAL